MPKSLPYLPPMNRRDFLRTGAKYGLAGPFLVGGLPALLAACGSSSPATTTAAAPETTAGGAAETTVAGALTTAAGTGTETTLGAAAETTVVGTAETTVAGATTVAAAPAADLGKLSMRLSWIKNSEFAGSYFADSKGYYKQMGFSAVDLITGGPSAQPIEVEVTSGSAFVGISSPDLVAAAIAKGADLVIIGAQYQKNPFCVMSLASKPVKSPEEMYGKTFGLQAANQVVWDAFVKASKIDDAKIKKVPAQFDPQPLVNGEADTWFSFVTNEPNTLKMKGIDTVTFLLADFGYPLISEVYVVKRESLTKERDKVKAFLKAEILGWRDVLKDPAEAARLTAEVYGKDLGLDAKEQILEVESENLLIWTDDTKANGVFTVTDALIKANIDTLATAGLTITADKLFDLSILEEIYQENPDWKKPPV
jgi:ABC-type nitrate/sulfonate/bicarbonate transport system substrate-binding protein